ncbi:MAG: DNA-protecting protein DprA [Gammaproteobacteria bacterium]|nr:DNA-protecting protein DprA [Gammaproteobacteria bacterium]
MDEELTARLALNRVTGVGPAAFSNLFQYFSSASAVFKANRTQLSHVPGLTDDAVDGLLKGIEATNVELDILWLEEDASHQVIFFQHQDYPELLARIHRPPPVLFLKGNAALLHTPQLSIVGSRNPTPGGIENARAFSAELAACGLTITSGLAAGIDGAAHQGALEARDGDKNGRTIAIAATGLDRIYPSHHRELAYRIVEKGLMVSEFPVGTGPLHKNFPRRNRVISGLSLGILVVEAAKRSGSLISARYAMEQDREVFAIPGSIHSPQSRGCHWLIKQGAKLVETSEDIAEEILMMLPSVKLELRDTNDSEIERERVMHDLSRSEQLLMNALGFDPVTLDSLLSRTGMVIDELSANLSQLELKGLIDSLPGGRFSSKLKAKS